MTTSSRTYASRSLLTAVFVGIACILLLPNLLFGVQDAHDINFHLVLFQSYRDAVEAGSWYPRWLPDQMHGLGSPALIFYPPLPTVFFVVVDALTLHALSPERVLGLGAFLLSALSAGTFFLWAKNTARTSIVLLAALFYATAPYHLSLDLYARGAMAEYVAFVWIPLIFLGIRKTFHQASTSGYVLLMVASAALLLTHLLTAMLVAPLAAGYLLVCVRNAAELTTAVKSRQVLMVAAAGLLGAALAAFYYYPAISLLSEANPAGLSRDVAASNIFSALLSLGDSFKVKILVFSSLYLIALVYLVAEIFVKWRQQRVIDNSMALAMLWVAAGISCFALMSGAMPMLFRPPSPYAQVQFAWRLLVVMEFSLASLLVSVAGVIKDQRSGQRMLTVIQCGLILLALLQVGDMALRLRKPKAVEHPMESAEVKWRLAPIEYFPAGTKVVIKAELAFRPFEQYALAGTPAFIFGDKGKILDAKRYGSTFVVHTYSEEAVPVSIQQFYFNGWKASDAQGHNVPVFRNDTVPLVTYVAPPGEQIVTIERTPTRQELQGNTISIVALVLSLLSVVWLHLRRKGFHYKPDIALDTKD